MTSSRSQRLGLEPGSVSNATGANTPLEGEIAHSIAISLKRLADAFERAEKHATGGQP